MIQKRKSLVALFAGILGMAVWAGAVEQPQSSLFIVELGGVPVAINTSQSYTVCPTQYRIRDSIGDLHIRHDSIFSDYGILNDEEIEKQIAPSLTHEISHDDARYLLDFLLKDKKLAAPATGYTQGVPFSKHKVFFFKTADNNYGAVIRYGEYIGGIDRAHCYLVTGKGGTTRLYKDSILEIPNSITFVPHVFSGRTDPAFTLHDNTLIKKLIYGIFSSINYVENPSLLIGTTSSWSSYGCFAFSGIFPQCSLTGGSATIEVGNGKIAIRKNTQIIVLQDPDSTLYKLIIETGCAEDPVSIDSYGSLIFRDIFSDQIAPVNLLNGWNVMLSSGNTPIKDVAGVRTADGMKVYAAGSHLYTGSISITSTGAKVNDSLKADTSLITPVKAIGSVGDTLYAGVSNTIYRKPGGSGWNVYCEGLPVKAGLKDTVSVLAADKNYTYATIGDSGLYCKENGQNIWQDALKKFGISLSTTIDKLPDNLPFEVLKFYLMHCHFTTSDNNQYVPVPNARSYENWFIGSVVKVGPAILAMTEWTCTLCSSTFAISGVVLQSLDGGKTFKVVIKRNNMPRIFLASSGEKAYCSILVSSDGDTSKWNSGMYVSEDNGSTWKFFEELPKHKISMMKIVDNYLFLSTVYGGLYFKDLAKISPVKNAGHRSYISSVKHTTVPLFIGKNLFLVKTPQDATEFSVSISNLQGRILCKVNQKTIEPIRLNNVALVSGVYLLRVNAGSYQNTQTVLFK